MTGPTAVGKTSNEYSSLSDRAGAFFGTLQQDENGRKLLAEQDHRIEFDLLDNRPFHLSVQGGEVAVHDETIKSQRYDCDDVIHFQLRTATLQRLLDGQIRFTDALVPSNPDGNDAMILLECTLLKWSVLNWVGRMFRVAQTRQRCI